MVIGFYRAILFSINAIVIRYRLPIINDTLLVYNYYEMRQLEMVARRKKTGERYGAEGKEGGIKKKKETKKEMCQTKTCS